MDSTGQQRHGKKGAGGGGGGEGGGGGRGRGVRHPSCILVWGPGIAQLVVC